MSHQPIIPRFIPYWTRRRIVEAVCQFIRSSGRAFPKYAEFRTEYGLPSMTTVLQHCGSLAVLRQLVCATLADLPPPPALRTCLGHGCTARFPKAEGWHKCRRCRNKPPEPDGAWLTGVAIGDNWWALCDKEEEPEQWHA